MTATLDASRPAIDQVIFEQSLRRYRHNPTSGWDALKEELVRNPLLIPEALPALVNDDHAREVLRMAATNAQLMAGIPAKQRALLEKILAPQGATAQSLGVHGYQEIQLAKQVCEAVESLSRLFGNSVIVTRTVTPGARAYTPKTGIMTQESTHFGVNVKLRR